MILNDEQIISKVRFHDMITPFEPTKIRQVNGEQVLSFGTQPFGYDIRIANQFAIFQPPPDWQGYIDPKDFDERLLRRHVGDFCMIPANSFALAVSIEYFKMPRNVTGVVLGKSTYARAGTIANFTPLEAGWEGNITIEISNSAPLPVKIYANEGFAQVLFLQGDMPTSSYGQGKYQGQVGITTAKI